MTVGLIEDEKGGYKYISNFNFQTIGLKRGVQVFDMRRFKRDEMRVKDCISNFDKKKKEDTSTGEV